MSKESINVLALGKEAYEKQWKEEQIEVIKKVYGRIDYHEAKIKSYKKILKDFENDETVLVAADENGVLKYKYI